MPQLKMRTMVVRTAVARFESTPATPILARMAVMPAKNAESKAQKNQFIGMKLAERGREVKWGWNAQCQMTKHQRNPKIQISSGGARNAHSGAGMSRASRV